MERREIECWGSRLVSAYLLKTGMWEVFTDIDGRCVKNSVEIYCPLPEELLIL
jgi:hypothetical protein